MQESFNSRNVTLAPIVIGLGSLFLDLFSKLFFKSHALPQGSFVFGWLEFTFHQNFGLLGNVQIPFAALLIINILAFGALIYGLYRAWKRKSICELCFLSLVFGGAVGNLYDRVVHGYVFDWILLFNTSIINLADIWITLGIAGFLICISTAKKIVETGNGV